MVNVVLLKKLMQCRGSLAPEDIKNCKTWMLLFKAHDLPFFLDKQKQNSICITHHYSLIILTSGFLYAAHPAQVEAQLLDGTFLFCPGRESDEVDTLRTLKNESKLAMMEAYVCFSSAVMSVDERTSSAVSPIQ